MDQDFLAGGREGRNPPTQKIHFVFLDLPRFRSRNCCHPLFIRDGTGLGSVPMAWLKGPGQKPGSNARTQKARFEYKTIAQNPLCLLLYSCEVYQGLRDMGAIGSLR